MANEEGGRGGAPGRDFPAVCGEDLAMEQISVLQPVDDPMPEQVEVPCRKQHCVDIPGVHSCEELCGTHMERVFSKAMRSTEGNRSGTL